MLYLNSLDFSYGATASVINPTSVPEYPKYIQVGNNPQHIAINPNTDKIYVANTGSNTVSVIDGSTNNVSNVIGINGDPQDIDVDPQTNLIYVANTGSNTVSVIDGSTNNILHNLPVEVYPTSIAVNTNTDKIYVANTGSNTVSVIDGTSLKNIKNVLAPIDQSGTLTVDPKKISSISQIQYVINS